MEHDKQERGDAANISAKLIAAWRSAVSSNVLGLN
jgi:hypothetical protein